MRAAALDAATTLLGTNKSHGVLRSLLPSLGNLVHDKTEKVRLAATRMLLQVKECPGIRFYHVVPVDHLMARLVAEEILHTSPRNAIAKELTALLLSSYFPQGQNMSANKLLQRTVSFLLTNPDAASVFYSNLVDHIEVESLVKFIIMLFTCLKTCVESDQASQLKKAAKMKKRRRGSTEDEDDSETSGLSAANTSLMASLANTINTLWGSLSQSLDKPKNKPYKRTLEDRFTDTDSLVDIMGHFERKGMEDTSQGSGEGSSRNDCFRTCSSMLDCAARVDENLTKKLVSFVMSSLHSMSKENSQSIIPLVTSYLSFLCTLKFEGDVAETIAHSIEVRGVEDVTLFSPDFEATMGLRRSRRSSFSSPTHKEGVVPHLSSFIAWGVLEHALQGASSQGRAIRQAILSSKSATRAIEKALEKGIKLSERLLADDSVARNFGNEEVEYAIRASEAYGRFALHKESSVVIQNDDSTSMARQVDKLLLWTSKKIVPAFMRPDGAGATALIDCDLSLISNRLSVSADYIIPPGSPSLMSPPKQKVNLGRTPEAMRGHTSLFVTTPNDLPIIYSAKVGGALLLSSCVLSSEMLAMGMTNADEISKAAAGWSQIFDQSKWPIEEQLLNAFIRLAIQLFRASGDSTLVEDLLVKCDSHFKETTVGTNMKKELQLLLRRRNGIDDLLPSFFAVSNRIIEGANESISFENASSSSEVWDKGGSIEVFLDAILGNSEATLSFARAIVKKLSSNDGEINDFINFIAKCLSLVVKEVDGPRMTRIVDDLDVNRFEKEGGMRVLVENLVECGA